MHAPVVLVGWVDVVHVGVGESCGVGGVFVSQRRCWWAVWASCMVLMV